jgi:CubicO group peptidase (beta-lactamase class C family)
MRCVIAFLMLVIASPVAGAELDAPFIESTTKTALDRWSVPGAVVAVVHGDNTFVDGYGVHSRSTNRRPTADTYVPLASCTKAVTVALLAMLADEGRLAWDDPVRKHLPDFHVADARVDELLTLRDLVSHRSGVRGHDLLWYRAPWDRDEVLKRVAKLPVDRPFRDCYEYSTIMVMAAGKVAERAAGKPWADLVGERIARPLGMKSLAVSTVDPRFRRADLLTGHRAGPDGSSRPVPAYETREPNAAGSIHLAARDLVPWLQFLLARGAFGGKRMLTEAGFAETHRPLNPLPMDGPLRALNPETVQMTYAMGWIVHDYRGRPVVAHGGMIDGFRVLVAVYPKDRLAVAIVNNLQESRVNQAIANVLADRALGVEPKDWNGILLDATRRESEAKRAEWAAVVKARRADVPPSVPLAGYAGRYEEPAYGAATVEMAKGKLVWKWSSFEMELEHWEGDLFRLPSGILEDRFVAFRVGKDGVEGFRFEGQTFQKK